MQLFGGLTPRHAKEGAAVHQGFVFVLLGLFAIQQLASNLMVAPASNKGHAFDSACGDGTSSDAASSDQCIEVQLFSSWHAAASDFDRALEQSVEASTAGEAELPGPASSNMTATAQPAQVNASTEPKGELRGSAMQRSGAEVSAEAEAKAATQGSSREGKLRGSAMQQSGAEVSAEPEAKAATEGSSHEAPTKGMVNADASSESTPSTEWGKGLLGLQTSIEESLRQLHEHQHQRHVQHSHGTQGAEWSNETAWAHGLDDLQHQMEKQMQALREKHRAAAARHVHVEHERPLVDEIMDVGREMCLDPRRRHRAGCEQFLASGKAAIGASPSDAAPEKADGAQPISDKIKDVTRELCSDPARRGYSACARFLKESPAAQPAALRGSRSSTPQLSWPRTPNRRLREVPVFSKHELLAARWNGKAPKVACIAVVPCGSMVEAWMRYAIDNFGMQHYEGELQLVLVYRHGDAEAARLVQQHADGTKIKGAAALDPEYPSATAFRFGAWSAASDADIIVRWDVDAWHHSQRISMQVRAMVLSSRPACLLKQWSMRNDKGELRVISGGAGFDAALAGEASWMRDHWYPMLGEGQDALQASKEREVVNVDVSGLVVYHEAMKDMISARCPSSSQHRPGTEGGAIGGSR